jgi:hypothetical protein
LVRWTALRPVDVPGAAAVSTREKAAAVARTASDLIVVPFEWETNGLQIVPLCNQKD